MDEFVGCLAYSLAMFLRHIADFSSLQGVPASSLLIQLSCMTCREAGRDAGREGARGGGGEGVREGDKGGGRGRAGRREAGRGEGGRDEKSRGGGKEGGKERVEEEGRDGRGWEGKRKWRREGNERRCLGVGQGRLRCLPRLVLPPSSSANRYPRTFPRHSRRPPSSVRHGGTKREPPVATQTRTPIHKGTSKTQASCHVEKPPQPTPYVVWGINQAHLPLRQGSTQNHTSP